MAVTFTKKKDYGVFWHGNSGRKNQQIYMRRDTSLRLYIHNCKLYPSLLPGAIPETLSKLRACISPPTRFPDKLFNVSKTLYTKFADDSRNIHFFFDIYIGIQSNNILFIPGIHDVMIPWRYITRSQNSTTWPVLSHFEIYCENGFFFSNLSIQKQQQQQQ